jgi:hypothetical protein
MSKVIHIVAVNDHLIVHEGLRLMLVTSEGLNFVGDAADGATY